MIVNARFTNADCGTVVYSTRREAQPAVHWRLQVIGGVWLVPEVADPAPTVAELEDGLLIGGELAVVCDCGQHVASNVQLDQWLMLWHICPLTHDPITGAPWPTTKVTDNSRPMYLNWGTAVYLGKGAQRKPVSMIEAELRAAVERHEIEVAP